MGNKLGRSGAAEQPLELASSEFGSATLSKLWRKHRHVTKETMYVGYGGRLFKTKDQSWFKKTTFENYTLPRANAHALLKDLAAAFDIAHLEDAVIDDVLTELMAQRAVQGKFGEDFDYGDLMLLLDTVYVEARGKMALTRSLEQKLAPSAEYEGALFRERFAWDRRAEIGSLSEETRDRPLSISLLADEIASSDMFVDFTVRTPVQEVLPPRSQKWELLAKEAGLHKGDVLSEEQFEQLRARLESLYCGSETFNQSEFSIALFQAISMCFGEELDTPLTLSNIACADNRPTYEAFCRLFPGHAGYGERGAPHESSAEGLGGEERPRSSAEAEEKCDPAGVLGNDVLVHIMSFLPVQSLTTCSRVSKLWYHASVDDGPWRLLFLERFQEGKSVEGPSVLGWKSKYVRHLRLMWRCVKAEAEQRRKLYEESTVASMMCCRMFHPSNGRKNFQWKTPERARELPPRDVCAAMLKRENELRLCSEVQLLYRNADEFCSIGVTDDVHRRVAYEFGFWDYTIVRDLVALSVEDEELSTIPHYVKYNRSFDLEHLKEGESLPQGITAVTMHGTEMSLSKAVCEKSSKKPVVILSGSYTWYGFAERAVHMPMTHIICNRPPFLSFVTAFNRMHEQYGREVEFLAVYIAEAHALDEWPVGERVALIQHKSIQERINAARRFVQNNQFRIPLVVDSMDNSFHRHMAAWPTRFYVVVDGVLGYVARPSRSHLYSVGEVEEWIKHFCDKQ